MLAQSRSHMNRYFHILILRTLLYHKKYKRHTLNTAYHLVIDFRLEWGQQSLDILFPHISGTCITNTAGLYCATLTVILTSP